MERVIKINGNLQNEKYFLKETYNGFGIYQRKTASGYYVMNEYLITDSKKTIVSYSFNNITKPEIQDSIDKYLKSKKFGFKAFNRNGLYIVHPNGSVAI